MDIDCCFLPIVCGCQTQIKPEGDQTPRLCPRCNNAAVVQAKSSQWFELCCVPVFPMSSKHLWRCNICSWDTPVGEGFEPQVMQPGGGYYPPPGQQMYPPPGPQGMYGAPQGYPVQGYPAQAYPAQAYPAQGYPQH